jgi:hypothetical protein
MSDFNYKKYLKNNPLLQKEAEETKLITEEKTTTEESDIKEVNESVSVLAGIGALLGSTAGLAKLLNYMQKNYPDQVDKFVKMVDKGNKASYSRLGEDEAEIQTEMASSNLELKSLAKKLFSGFKNMGADVELSTDKVTLDKAPSGDLDEKNVWINVNDDGISVSLVGDKAISFNDKIQKDFSDFEFIERQDSKSWNDQDVKNLLILPGKDMSEGYGKKYEEDDIKKEEMSSKMKKSELKAKIKEDIISLLQEDEIEYETPLEEEEEVEIDIEDKVEVEEPELDASVAQTGLSDDEKEIQDALKLAYDNAQAIGDEKLADQIGNSITFFTRTHVVER